MGKLPVSIGLYRHFKGSYFYVSQISKSCTNDDNGSYIVNYFNVCKPELGMFSRKMEEFVSTSCVKDGAEILIKDREDNVTGQYARMERVKSLDFQLGSISTEQLIDELQKRKDSPIHELDIDGLRSPVFCTDYVVGIKHFSDEFTEESTPEGVETINVFFDEDEAHDYLSEEAFKGRKAVFKRVFIEVQ